MNGFLVKDDAEWIRRLSEFLENTELRQKLGAAGRKQVEERFALERQAELLAKVFSKVAVE